MNKIAEYIQWRAIPDIVVTVFNENRDELLEKGAESPVLSELAKLWQIKPGKMFGAIPNAAGPLASLLVGGMAGAGLGYGAGWLGEQLLPNRWEKGKLRRNLALMGAGIGALPGAGYIGLNIASGQPWNHAGIRAGYKPPPNPDVWTPPEIPRMVSPGDLPMKKFSFSGSYSSFRDNSEPAYNTGVAYLPPIDVNELNQVIWREPEVARRLPPHLQAATSGLIVGAANLPGRQNTNWVTPMDVGRMAAGMGSGYMSGLLVGKALGAMMGMPQDTQDKLKQTGMWAGVIANIIPKAFGG